MLYYLGKGEELKKEECKEYKTLEGALKAAAKDENTVVWDESGKIVGSLTDNVPDGALQENPDGSVPAFDENGNPAGAVDTETAAEAATLNDESEENPPGQQLDKIVPQDKMKVTVVCNGSLNLRRSASWSPNNICGRATKGQTYQAKAIHTVDGKQMIETIDGLFLSGDPAHIQIG
ncbi:MAG: hypothetical protein IJ567_05565 [Lachnospiraceae bacterium]|nr:hypothetical protein [Lachnospiraceae bacterium]